MVLATFSYRSSVILSLIHDLTLSVQARMSARHVHRPCHQVQMAELATTGSS